MNSNIIDKLKLDNASMIYSIQDMFSYLAVNRKKDNYNQYNIFIQDSFFKTKIKVDILLSIIKSIIYVKI